MFLPGWENLLQLSPEISVQHNQAKKHLRTEQIWAAWLDFRMLEAVGPQGGKDGRLQTDRLLLACLHEGVRKEQHEAERV